jgi:hypothetical protein
MVILGEVLVILVRNQEVVMNSVFLILLKFPALSVVLYYDYLVPLLASPQPVQLLPETLDLVAPPVTFVMDVLQPLHQLPPLQMLVMQSV